MSSKRDWLAYCLAKPGAWRDEPWEGDVVVKVGDKIFAFLGSVDPVTAIGLKCGDREAADIHLERYPDAARKMPYIGAHGWNTFTIDGTIPDDELCDLVDASYEMIVAKLPKSKRPTAVTSMPESDVVTTLRRWEEAGGVWRVLARRPDSLTIALCRCDGGEEADRFTSGSPDLIEHVGDRAGSED